MVNKQVQTDTGVVNFRCSPGKGTPIVIIHGLLDNSISWDYISQALTAPVLAVDLPGAGGSSLAAESSIECYAETVANALKTFSFRKYYLLGHSLGGAVASKIADLYPQRVKGLTLVAPAGYGKLPIAEIASMKGISNILALGTPWAFRSQHLLNLGYMNLVSYRKPMEGQLRKRLSKDREIIVPGALCATKVLARLSREPYQSSNYSGEVNVIWGDKDHLTHLNHSKQVQKVFPQANLYIMEGIGHHPQYENQLEFLQKASHFCQCRLQEVAGSEIIIHRKRKRRLSPLSLSYDIVKPLLLKS